MCTVTFLPTGPDAYLFTSNRDEAPSRSAAAIQEQSVAQKQLIYPQDSLAKGTWIAISDHNQLVCILNGAFQPHQHRPPYRLSRGIMALEFFQYEQAEQFSEQFEFEGMEPFTMIIYDQGRLFDLRWDEEQVHFAELSISTPHIWSSAPLYYPDWQIKRQQWFKSWLDQQATYTSECILDFHKNGGEGDPQNDLIMNRFNMVCTTSITHIIKDQNEASLQYHGLLSKHNIVRQLKLVSP